MGSKLTTGFNPDKVKGQIETVKKAYSNIATALTTDFTKAFPNKIKDYWACQQAKSFFAEVKSSVTKLKTSSGALDDTYESVIKSMNSAAQAWAQKTGDSSIYSIVSFSKHDGSFSDTSIRDNINGDRGIDVAQATSISAAAMTNLKTKVSTATASAMNAIDSSGFIGGSMASDLKDSLQSIKKAVDKAVEDLAEACDKAISDTTKAYGDLATDVSTKFKGQ